MTEGGLSARPLHLWSVLLGALVVLGAVLGLALSAAGRPVYTASATLFVSTGSASSVADLGHAAVFTNEVAASVVGVATSRLVLQPVIDDLHLSTTPEALAHRVVAEQPPDTVLIRISATDSSAARAASLANAVADRLGHVVPPRAGAGAAELTVVTTAVPPTAPSAPNVLLDAVLGALAGTATWLIVVLVEGRRGARPPRSGGLAAPSML